MELRTPEAARAALATLPPVPTLLLATFAERQCQGIALATGADHVLICPLRAPHGDPRTLHAVAEWLQVATPRIWVESVADAARLAYQWNLPVLPNTDLSLAGRVLGVRAPLPPTFPSIELSAERVPQLYPLVEQISQLTNDLRAVLQLETRAAFGLALESLRGYVTPAGTAHPEWITVQPDGSGRISCRGPNLLGVKRGERGQWRAPDGAYAWVQLKIPFADLRMAAALSDDAWLKSVLDAPYTRLAEAADLVTDERAAEVWPVLLRNPFDAEYLSQKIAWLTPEAARTLVARLEQLAPAWRTWVDVQRATPTARSFMNRPIRWDSDADPNDRVKVRMTALVQQSVATLLKTQLVQLFQLSRMGVPSYAGIENVIPLYESLLYTVPMKTLASGHLTEVVTTLRRAIRDVTFPLEPYVGPTWGGLQPVDLTNTFAEQATQLAADQHPFLCEECGAIFETEAQLARHKTEPAPDGAPVRG